MQSEEYQKCIRHIVKKYLTTRSDEVSMEEVDKTSKFFLQLKNDVRKNDVEDTVSIIDCFLVAADRSDCTDRIQILLLIDYFFTRSWLFREKFVLKGKDFLEIFCETNPMRRPLPGGSRKKSNHLKLQAIKVIHKWDQKFPEKPVFLRLIVDNIKCSKSLDFDGMNAQNEASRKRKEKLENRRKLLMESTNRALESQFSEIRGHVEGALMELDSALRILVPCFIGENAPSTSKCDHIPIDTHFTVVISKPEVNVNKDNDAIVEAVLDAKKSLKIQQMRLKKLFKRTKTMNPELKNAIRTLRIQLTAGLRKAEDLTIKGFYRKCPEFEEDDEFVDVEDFSVDEILMIQYSKKAEKEVVIEQPKEKEESTSKIPAVPFGLDLKYWGEKREDVEIPRNDAGCHQFWRPVDEEASTSKAHQDVYTQRVFNFVGTERKSDKICRARLRNGALCPRKDFEKCPIHGTIVERDDQGQPIHLDDRRKVQKIEESRRKREMEEISKQIWEKHSKKKKKQKREEVEDDDNQLDPIRQRLQKKLLDPRTVTRVSKVLDSSRKARLQQKFGHQYSHI